MSGKKERLIELDIHRRKLIGLVSELLRKADELDHAGKGEHAPTRALSDEWHEQHAGTCRDLAELSQACGSLDQLLKSGKVTAAEQSLLRCVNIANHLSNRLNELKRQL